eukprot:7525541-Pyramimonas_sp.AAC.1
MGTLPLSLVTGLPREAPPEWVPLVPSSPATRGSVTSSAAVHVTVQRPPLVVTNGSFVVGSIGSIVVLCGTPPYS